MDDESLDRFLKKDNEYEDRKNQLSNVFLNIACDNKRRFGTAVINALFDPAYVATHRWPTIL